MFLLALLGMNMKNMNRMIMRRVGVGAEPPVEIDPRAYFTLDAKGQRWDLYPQPSTGVWTGYTPYYQKGEGVMLFSDKEEALWERIAAFVDLNTPVKLDKEPDFPPRPYKPIPSTPVFGPPSKPPSDDIVATRGNDLLTADRSSQSSVVTFVVVSLLATAGLLLARFA